MQKDIIIKGAREHNLKNINITIPRDKLIVITGISGSGKSTLAFDTIYAEGQRRYVESLSAYARQFLGIISKPDVDSIEGLSPAISIEQKTTSKNPRSTVGTVTEIYDYLRLLFARIGIPHCPICKKPIRPQSPDEIVNKIIQIKNQKIQVLSPIIRQKKGTYEANLENLRQKGFTKVRVDKKIYDLTTDIKKIKLDRYVKHDIEVIIDEVSSSDRQRVQESVENALKLSEEGLVIIIDEKSNETTYSSRASCPDHDVNFEELQPRMFSFNSPFGACELCHGLGFKMRFDPDLIIPDYNLSIYEGAIDPWKTQVDGFRGQALLAVSKKFGFNLHTPIKDLKKEHLNILLYGTDTQIKYKYQARFTSSSWEYTSGWEGIVNTLQRVYNKTDSDEKKEDLQKYMAQDPCEECKGKRLKQKILAVTINNRSIIEITDLCIKDCLNFFQEISLTKTQQQIAKQILKEIKERLAFLVNVGLDYLTLSRSAGTLSGGEAQRIRLATQIGSNLMGVLYILDEPSIGLHQRDNNRLIATLKKLRDIGNTLIVVEHDEPTMLAADHIIDIGPGAGIHGGFVVAQGTPKQIISNPSSLTGQYLSGKKKIDMPNSRRKSDKFIKIIGASKNNLKNINVDIPINVFTVITGVSGSGKSSLINETLHPALTKKLHSSSQKIKFYKDIIIDGDVDKVIVIDQSPIGRTPRSNPATYTKVFDDVRKIYAMTKEAKMRGYGPGRFSFNVRDGRCENCQGDGLIKIEMNFLADVYVECEVCKGKRYSQETLEVKYKDKNISDVLNMTVEEAVYFFENIPPIKRKLQTLFDVGLSYIKLGQSSTTLSGGEAQRIKLTRELAKKSLGHTVYILDEPTTGLHFDDVKKLLDVLNRLVDKKNTVIVIEHNLDVIKTADYIIDLGPEGGDQGGKIIAYGTPEELIKNNNSHTARFLKEVILNNS